MPAPRARHDDAWFTAQITRCHADLSRFACWLTRDPALAEDLIQETLLRAWRFRRTLTRDASMRQWLLAIARREFARTRERKLLATIELGELPEQEHPPSHDGCPAELAEIEAAVGRLRPALREALLLRTVHGYSTREVARITGAKPILVGIRLFRARRSLEPALLGVDAAG